MPEQPQPFRRRRSSRWMAARPRRCPRRTEGLAAGTGTVRAPERAGTRACGWGTRQRGLLLGAGQGRSSVSHWTLAKDFFPQGFLVLLGLREVLWFSFSSRVPKPQTGIPGLMKGMWVWGMRENVTSNSWVGTRHMGGCRKAVGGRAGRVQPVDAPSTIHKCPKVLLRWHWHVVRSVGITNSRKK